MGLMGYFIFHLSFAHQTRLQFVLWMNSETCVYSRTVHSSPLLTDLATQFPAFHIDDTQILTKTHQFL